MNLHSIVSGPISAVNPFIGASIAKSAGYVTNPDGSRSPNYAAGAAVSLQVQALTFTDITKLDALNIQGTRRAIYAFGAFAGLIRIAQKGGDVIVFPNGTLPDGNVWLVAHMLEEWNDGAGTYAWCKAAITLQDGS